MRHESCEKWIRSLQFSYFIGYSHAVYSFDLGPLMNPRYYAVDPQYARGGEPTPHHVSRIHRGQNIQSSINIERLFRRYGKVATSRIEVNLTWGFTGN